MSTIYQTTRTLTVEVAGAVREIPLNVSYAYAPPCMGSRERGTGLQLDRDEPAGVELLAATITGIDAMPLLDLEMIRELEDDILNAKDDDHV